jgi:hypothetical protein
MRTEQIVSILAVISMVSAAKLTNMMSSNTFIQNADAPTDIGRFVVWNDQVWHYGNGNRLRMWQRSAQTWIDLTNSVFGQIPSLRNDAEFAVACDRLYLYGGSDANGNSIPQSDNFYSFDPAISFAWTKLEYKIGQTVPSARNWFGFVGAGTKIYLFGGLTDYPPECQTAAHCDGCLLMYDGKKKQCLKNDLHEYSPETGVWRPLNHSGGAQPCERMEFGIAAGQGKLFVLGGTTFRTDVPGVIGMKRWTGWNGCGWLSTDSNIVYRVQDLWSYDLVSNQWTALPKPVLNVGFRPGFVFHNNTLYAMGGYNGKEECINCFISMDLKADFV